MHYPDTGNRCNPFGSISKGSTVSQPVKWESSSNVACKPQAILCDCSVVSHLNNISHSGTRLLDMLAEMCWMIRLGRKSVTQQPFTFINDFLRQTGSLVPFVSMPVVFLKQLDTALPTAGRTDSVGLM